MPTRLASVLVALLFFIGCSRAQRPPQNTPAPAPAAAAGKPAEVAAATPTQASPPPAAAPSAEVPTLHLLVPAGHVPPWLASDLGAALGAKISVLTYASEAEFEAHLHSGDAPFDVIGTTDQLAAEMISSHQLRPLPENLVPPANQPSAEYLHHYLDPLNRQTWPYAFTLFGFVVHSSPGAAAPRNWRGLAEINPLNFAGNDALRAALWEIALNKPPGAGDPLPAAWQNAGLDMPAADAPASGARVDTIARLLLLSKPDGEVVLPAEGSAIVLYSWAIPADAPNPQLAEAAVRALAVPARAARIAAENRLAATQPEARKLLPPAVLADPLVYPPEHVLNQCRFVRTPDTNPAAAQ